MNAALEDVPEIYHICIAWALAHGAVALMESPFYQKLIDDKTDFLDFLVNSGIRMGNKVNVQDGAVIHATFQKTKAIIGNNVSIGHNAIVHGCKIHDNVLVGMGSIIMDNCVVESNSIIAAGAVVTQNTIVESGTIYAGVPAKKVKDIDQSDFAGEIERISNNYVMYSSWFKEE